MSWIKKWSFADENLNTRERLVRLCDVGARFFVSMWALLMLTVFPLYMKNRFSRLGECKFQFFLEASLFCLIPAAVLALLRMAAAQMAAGKPPVGKIAAEQPATEQMAAGRTEAGQTALYRADFSLSPLDCAMLAYGVAAFASWKFSVNREVAWIGTEGWYGGLRTQILLIAVYFLVSRFWSWSKIVLTGHFIGSGLVFLVGIGHRFGIDPLGLYEGIDVSYQLRFLSTIGQATWYSSYVCTVLVIGVTLFFLTKRPVLRAALGAYCGLGFATVVTQNSDSAFVAMAFLCFGLFLAACDELDKLERFLEVVILMFGTFKLVGLFQILLPERAMRLDGLSEFLSRGLGSWGILLFFCICYMGLQFYRSRKPERMTIKCGKLLRRLTVAGAVTAFCLYVLVLWANTAGVPEKLWGLRWENTYLLFDYRWGNSRGFIWKFVWDAFGDFSTFRKLVGIGPDCFSAYCYANEETAAYLSRFFGHDQTLTNAHNEFLNMLFCTGILGLVSYLGVFVTALGRFFKERKKHPLALLGALAVLVYVSHNFFCYQQVCCTPFLFLILGMADSAVRNIQKSAGEDLL